MDKKFNYKIMFGDKEKVTIIKENMQEIDLKDNISRISIGGNDKLGYYFVFRAQSLDDIDKMMDTVHKAFKKAREIYIKKNN